MNLLKSFLGGLLVAECMNVSAADHPRKDDVLDIINLVNEYWQSNNSQHGNWFWNRAVYHVGNMFAYRATGESSYLDFSTAWAEKNSWSGPWGDNTADWKYEYGEYNVLFGDCQICFQVFSELDDVESEEVRLARALQVMGYQIETDKTDYLFWVDGMFMVMPTLSHLYLKTNNEKYLTRMHEYWEYTNSIMYDAEDSLYYRDSKYVYPTHTTLAGGKDFWARGNGWAFATFARVLTDLPENHSDREEYIEYYKRMAKSLSECQQEDGYWTRSLLDASYAPGPETSGTALMLYAYLWGVNNNIITEEEYGETIDKAWTYLSTTALRSDGLVGYIQPIGENADPNNTVSETSTADFGVGAYLMAACEMLEYAVESSEPRPLKLISVTASDESITLKFNENVNVDDTSIASHFLIDGEAVEVASVETGEKTLTLYLSNDLRYGSHEITVSGLSSDEGGAMESEQSLSFFLTVPLTPNTNIVSVVAIGNQSGNPAENSIDNNISTRWSQDGVGQWITYELDTVRSVTAVDLAFYQGSVRYSYFDVEVSEDGETFSTVLSDCTACGTTDSLERFYFESPTNARYVRIVCNGNSQGGANWNSITEARVVGEKAEQPVVDCISAVSAESGVLDVYSINGVKQGTFENVNSENFESLQLPEGFYILKDTSKSVVKYHK